jgi:hypothetical protein
MTFFRRLATFVSRARTSASRADFGCEGNQHFVLSRKIPFGDRRGPLLISLFSLQAFGDRRPSDSIRWHRDWIVGSQL